MQHSIPQSFAFSYRSVSQTWAISQLYISHEHNAERKVSFYFSFSPFPDLMCYLIQKMIQMGKTSALKQEAGGRKKGTQDKPLLSSRSPWGEILPA